METNKSAEEKFCKNPTKIVCPLHEIGKPCSECVDTTEATNFLIKELKPKDGKIKGVAVNMDYMAYLMEEYAKFYHQEQLRKLKEEIADLINEAANTFISRAEIVKKLNELIKSSNT